PAARNFIKGKTGEKVLLTVSVKKSKGAFQNYNELELDYSSKWNIKHLNQIKDAYIKAPHFKSIYPEVEAILKQQFPNLAALNIAVIKWALGHLDIKTRIETASEFDDGLLGTKNDRNLNICLHFKASAYLSGHGAKKYNDEQIYREQNVELLYSDYSATEYPQINGDFVPNLSVLDVLFNCGADAKSLIV
ncbi:MAG: WbqC family protein, partial [Bacteroidia bacterium]